MNETTFMIITESIIKHNKMNPDRSQLNKKPGLITEYMSAYYSSQVIVSYLVHYYSRCIGNILGKSRDQYLKCY